MKTYDHFLFPIYLIALGLIIISGVNIFGAAALEGAAWKQNVIFGLLLIFGMLPPSAREMRSTWMATGLVLGFFLFGGANLYGTVGMILKLEKILLAILVLFTSYRLWSETWVNHKLYMLIPVIAIVSVALLIPIKDQNIIGSGIEALKSWSTSQFTSDKGFHIYLGIIGITSGISEILIFRNFEKNVSVKVNEPD